MANQFTLEIIYATHHHQHILQIEVREGITVSQALSQANIAARWPELANSALNLASFGRTLKLDDALMPYDRIEILANILCDPKMARIRRVKN